jgi:cytoskeletal protein RodZ
MGELETKLGSLLKGERERQGKKLADIAEALRISERHLQAIEEGDSESLPGPIYFGLFAKSYSESLGIDYNATSEAIKADIAEREAHPPRQKRAKEPDQGAAEEGAVGTGEESEDETEEPKKKSRLQVILYAAAAVVIVVGGYFLVSQLLEDMSAQSGENGAGGGIAESAGGLEAVYASYDFDHPEYQPPDSLRLRLTPRGESWATILADGDTVIFRNLMPGRVYNVAARYRMTVSVAVPRMVDIELNGAKVTPVDPETGRISRVSITQMNIDSLINYRPPVQDQTEVPVRRQAAPIEEAAPETGSNESTVSGDTTSQNAVEF